MTDRSQYEDVLIARAEDLVAPEDWEKRYDQINAFESELVDQGYALIKCYLHLSKDEQKKRFAARLGDESKFWKYNPGDLERRARWDRYMEAYNAALTRCSTEDAPWYVIPADKKWYRDWAVAELLREKLSAMRLGWPEPDFDVEAERRRVSQC